MKNKIIIVMGLLTLMVSYGCNKSESVQKDVLTPEAIAKADSLQQLAMLHRSFVGRHKHNTSLKVHAHQNPSKKVRVFRKQAESADLLRQGMKKANEDRKKRINKILEKKSKDKSKEN